MTSRPPEIIIWAQGNPFLAHIHQYLPLFFKKKIACDQKIMVQKKCGPAPWGLNTPGDWTSGGGGRHNQRVSKRALSSGAEYISFGNEDAVFAKRGAWWHWFAFSIA